MISASRRSILDSRSLWSMLFAGLFGVLLLSTATRSVMTHPLMYDELLHLLSARGVVETGQPVIGDGIYARAEIFTRLVAAVFEWRGESPWNARLPALASALGLVLLTGAWVTRNSGLLAGTVASILLALTTSSIELASFARFYTLHALVMLVFYVAVFEACEPGRSRVARIFLGLLAVAVVPIAWALQKTTMIAVGGAAAGVLALVVLDHRSAVTVTLKRRPLLYLLAALTFAGAGAFGAWRLGIHELAGTAPLWAQGRSGDAGFYLRMFGREWPFFWTALPLAAMAAFSGYRRFAWFCIVVPLAAIAVHSASAAKAMRYVYYAVPLLCAVIGCGTAAGLKLLAGWIGSSWPLQATRATAIAALVFLAMAVNTQEVRLGARFLAGKATWHELGMFASESDWRGVQPVIEPFLTESPTVVVSSGFKGLYYLGDYDYELNASTVLETESTEEFGRDRRTGRRAIGSVESLARVLAESPGTLIIGDLDKLGRTYGIAPEVVDLIDARCRSLDLAPESRVSAWHCGDGRFAQ